MLDDFREWLSDNLRYILLGAAVLVVVLVIFLVVRLVSGGSSDKRDKDPVDSAIVQDDGNSVEAESENNAPGVPASSGQGASELVKDDAAILTLIRKLYSAIASQDVTTLSEIVVPWNDEIEEELLKNVMIESYNNISTYSKPGLNQGDYMVYVYFEGKLADFETLAPSLRERYVVTAEDGSLKIKADREDDPAIQSFVENAMMEDDVQQLVKEVNEKYDQVLASDDALRAFLAAPDAASSGNSSAQEGQDTGSDAASSGTRKATADLNIRQQMDTNSSILSVVPTGSEVTVLGDESDGWTHISFTDANGVEVEGYVRTEYLS